MKFYAFKNLSNWRGGILLSLGFLFFAYSSAAQERNENNALFKVVYEFTHVDDSTQRDRPRQEEMNLYINTNASLYRRFTEEDSEFHRHMQGGGQRETYDLNLILDRTASLYHSVENQVMVNTERIGPQMYQIRESLQPIAWEIEDEQKQIGEFTAQSARGHFAGRDYQVWFVADIPLPFGPWKLQGLPGLILEARDSKNDVIFTFKSLEQMKGPAVNLTFPDGIKQMTGAEYEKTYNAFMDNPQAFYKAIAGPGMRVVSGTGGGAVGSRPAQEKVYNNPMELTNRKK